MTRKDFKKWLKENNKNQNRLCDDEIVEYVYRLIKSYTKKEIIRYFFIQYIDGSGDELKSKFWSCNSSSRFAFEMYSWLAYESKIDDIQFEFKLPGICSQGVPNMDVYIEYGKRFIFIESKLTEEYEQQITDELMPDAYYKDLDEEPKDTKGKPIKTSLYERYYGELRASKAFRNFILDIKDRLLNNNDENCWMEYSQEIKHLYGIFFYVRNLVNANKLLKGTSIEFYNVYYDLEDKVGKICENFFEDSQKMMQELFDSFGLDLTFTYKPLTAQNIVKKFPNDAKCFGKENINVKQLLKDKYNIN